MLLTIWELLEVLLLKVCSCWKRDTLCCSLFREVVLGVMLMTVVLLISIAACLQLLGRRVQVFCKSRTGLMCDWISSFLSHGEDVLPLHTQFSSVWEAFDLLNYSRQLLKCEITCMMVPSVWVAIQCVGSHWSAPVKSLDTNFCYRPVNMLQVVVCGKPHIWSGWSAPESLGSVCPRSHYWCLFLSPCLFLSMLLLCLQLTSTRKAMH